MATALTEEQIEKLRRVISFDETRTAGYGKSKKDLIPESIKTQIAEKVDERIWKISQGFAELVARNPEYEADYTLNAENIADNAQRNAHTNAERVIEMLGTIVSEEQKQKLTSAGYDVEAIIERFSSCVSNAPGELERLVSNLELITHRATETKALGLDEDMLSSMILRSNGPVINALVDCGKKLIAAGLKPKDFIFISSRHSEASPEGIRTSAEKLPSLITAGLKQNLESLSGAIKRADKWPDLPPNIRVMMMNKEMQKENKRFVEMRGGGDSNDIYRGI